MMDTLVRPGDVVAVYFEEKIAFYARVEEILPDVKRGWRRFRFLMLSVPTRDVTWILEPAQIDGQSFTMGGAPVRIERVPECEPTPLTAPEPAKEEAVAKVISFPGRAKK